MGNETTKEQLLQDLKAVATKEATQEYRAADREAKALINALETSKVLDPETLKRPVTI